MDGVKKNVAAWYRWCLARPFFGLLFIAILCSVAAYNAQHFYYDASADSLVAEDDPELLYYRDVSSHFGGEDFLFLTYTPKNAELLSHETIAKLDNLVQRLSEVDGIESITSLLDAPLLKSPPIPLSELSNGYNTLRSEGVDLKAALHELTTSPLFNNLLISEDGKTTAIRIDLADAYAVTALLNSRDNLRLIDNPTPEETEKLEEVSAAYRAAYAARTEKIERVLEEVRVIRDSITKDAIAHLGGVPMIASDMIHYVKKDILIFGGASVLLMMVTLFLFFKRMRWVLLPLATTSVTILLTIGLLGFLHKPVTVISSNFISLLIILSVSIGVHLISKYREILSHNPKLSHTDIIYQTMSKKLAPCLYTTLTTIAGFASLATSSIIPVMDFGLIMCVSVFLSFLVFYSFFPSVLALLPKTDLAHPARDNNTPFICLAYHLSADRTRGVILFAVILAILTFIGASKISLDNRFLDYFKPHTEIHQGLAFIDKNLGGTIPMDIIVKFPPYVEEEIDEEDDFFVAAEEDVFPERYWFTPDKVDYLKRLGDYLESRVEIGKVLSLSTLESVARGFNDGKALGAVEIAAILGAMPERARVDFITPYAAPAAGIMRITTRIHETGPLFSRDALIADIENFSINELGLEPGRVRATGVNVLFNNMLKELFSSQTSTLLFVIGATLMMFFILLRSARFAIIGLLPNLLSAFLILGFMGFAKIPLDMMTITIAAIVIGIGVDDAIHYLHCLKESYKEEKDMDAAIRKSHREIGRALYITTLTVVIGFSILAASNFVPSVYFGLFAASAMILALLANLVLLPALLLKFYPSKG